VEVKGGRRECVEVKRAEECEWREARSDCGVGMGCQ